MIVVAVPDLLFRSKIAEVARHKGVEVRFVRDAESLLTEIANGATQVFLDLDVDPLRAAVAKIQGIPVLGFYSHVHADHKVAGCRAMTRGEFARRLPELL